MTHAVQYADLADALARLGYSQDAAEYHGALCGTLCVQPASQIDVDDVVPTEGIEQKPGDATAHRSLERLRSEAFAALESSDAIFAPLLPDDDAATLADRTRALAQWCEGFLYGLASRGTLDLDGASPEVREMVNDLVQFSKATSADDEDQEVEENAYAELVEYVRVGAQLIYMELHPRDPDGDADAPRLH
jgi:uncharacterized protein YgfB (UPF0149 family)